jgi:hypothetical protein
VFRLIASDFEENWNTAPQRHVVISTDSSAGDLRTFTLNGIGDARVVETTAALTAKMFFIDTLTEDNEGTSKIQISRVGGSSPIAPIVTRHPTARTLVVGENTVFTVQVAGSEPMAYQWRKDNLPLSDGGRIAGSTTAMLSLTAVDPTDAGNYDVVVSNVAGSATSDKGRLTVSPGYFADITERAGIPKVESKLTSAAFGDFNADGWLDIYQASVNGFAERLLPNLGQGKFQVIDNPTGTGSSGDFLFANFGDFNNDGLPDLLLGGRSTPRLYRGDGLGGFTDVTSPAGLNQDAVCQNGPWVDYDSDGWLDVFLGGSGTPPTLYRN